MDDDFGEPQVLARVGHQYQAEIPPLMESNSLPSTNILTGTMSASRGEYLITSSNGHADPSVQQKDTMCLDRESMTDQDYSMEGKSSDEELKLQINHDGNTIYLPDASGEAWTGAECDIFLLGLYLFGKNLLLVKRFVGSKRMGDILNFYYGKFYRSERYYRWLNCRKFRSRRCATGQKMITGWRQQELLSRLSSHISEDCQNKLVEVFRTFDDGKISFEEYLLTLKDTVGASNLVNAVGIGTGKRDLTRMVSDSRKKKQAHPSHLEIPIGKACSSLSSKEIVKFLTGDFRLSKARSSDLFWEAVWPRLLAQGWHSEQPKNHGSLVFLVPGIKKFSKSRLVKGNHYFDSVTDVLSKVASEPGLIELELGGVDGSSHEEESSNDPSPRKDSSNMSSQKVHHYLRPHHSKSSPDSMSFLIVDTSSNCLGRAKMREMRRLPIDTTSLSTCFTNLPQSSKNASNASEVSEYKSEVSENGGVAVESDKLTKVIIDDKPIVLNKCRFNWELKPVDPENVGSITEKQDLSPFIRGESQKCVEDTLWQRKTYEPESHLLSEFPAECKNVIFPAGSPHELLGACSPDKIDRNGDIYKRCDSVCSSLEKKHSHSLIDLNIPQLSTDTRVSVPSIVITVRNDDQACPAKASLHSEPLKLSSEPSHIEQHPITVNSRHSTRNRPLTRKALEAIECGLFNVKRKRKDAVGASKDVLETNSSHQMGVTGSTSPICKSGLATTGSTGHV